MYKIALMFLATGLLISCSSATYYTTNGEKHYLESRNATNIVVPAPLSKNNISDFYNLPTQTQDAHVNVTPPTELRS